MLIPGSGSPEQTLPRLLIADDHQLILDALSAMLKAEYEVQAVNSYAAFADSVEAFRPDVALLDVSLPEGEGFTAAQKVLEKRPGLPIVFLSMYLDSTYVTRAAAVGAKAYFSKKVPARELLDGVRAVLDGQNLLPQVKSEANAETTGALGLTARQIEVLRLIATGSTAKDIARRLNISVRTAEFHRAAIMQRLKLRSTAQMTRFALVNNFG